MVLRGGQLIVMGSRPDISILHLTGEVLLREYGGLLDHIRLKYRIIQMEARPYPIVLTMQQQLVLHLLARRVLQH